MANRDYRNGKQIQGIGVKERDPFRVFNRYCLGYDIADEQEHRHRHCHRAEGKVPVADDIPGKGVKERCGNNGDADVDDFVADKHGGKEGTRGLEEFYYIFERLGCFNLSAPKSHLAEREEGYLGGCEEAREKHQYNKDQNRDGVIHRVSGK
ncbi:MAG: hypothetical protein AVO38_15430 [delta proteobacterium ML8_D]|nr:MAG: hypothetical protein AVO38_15430 [delta proteobacterium ML8_D]